MAIENLLSESLGSIHERVEQAVSNENFQYAASL
jgi:hypothetical protein